MAAQQGGRFAAVRRYRHAMPGRTNLHHRAASPPERPRYSVRPADRRESGDRWIFQSNAKPENEGRRRRNGQVIVVLLAFAWGLNWVAAAIALREVTPWSLRVAGSSLGAALLFSAAIITGHKLHVPRREY